METKSSNLSVLLEEGVKRGRVKMDFETEIRYDDADDCDHDDNKARSDLYLNEYNPVL